VGVAEDEAARAHNLGEEGEAEEKNDAEAGEESAASARHAAIVSAHRRYNSSMSWNGTPARARIACAIVVGAFAFSCAWFTGFFPPFSNPNELSRFQMVVAFVETGTFAIDSQVAVLGDHEDKASAGGRFYSNKAPGLALAAIPVYRMLRLLFPAPDSPTSPIFALVRLFTVSLLCVVALARFAKRLLARREWEPVAAIVTFAVAFGTPFLYYARSFFGHAWTAALLFLAWDALTAHHDDSRTGRSARGAVLAGLLAGWALISEYTVAPVVVALAFRAAASVRMPRRVTHLLIFAAGAAVPVAVLLVYQAVCFGSPFLPSYAREAYPAYAELARRRFFGFELPSARIALAYLFHPARGILVFSPFFLWAGVGFARWCRDRRERADGIFALAATVATFLLLASYPNWHGGWALGSRYLLPLLFLPALAIPWALGSPVSRGVFTVAAAFSAASHVLATVSWPHFPADLAWHPATGSFWFLERGWVAPNVGTLAGAGAAVSLALPLAAALVALVLAVRAARPLVPAGPAAVFLGLGPLVVLCLVRPPLTYGGELWRSAIYGAYSGLDPERTELARVVDAAATDRERRQALGAWTVYGPRR
jgi:hypothetical protein